MNFITRNLGWILLLIFFLFMLFIISSHSKKEDVSQTWSTLSGEVVDVVTDDDLDNLVKMLDEEDSENSENDTAEVDNEAKPGFFASLFGKNKKKAEEVKDVDTVETVVEESTSVDTDASETTEAEETSPKEEEKKEGLFSKLFGGNDEKDEAKESFVAGEQELSSEKNLMKDTNIVESVNNIELINTYAPEINAQDYPGVDLETEIGKEFEIGVFSLKLNNAYFNETLAYMLRGDRVKQLTQENVRGCFMVEITKSQNPENTWKTWYVCKKYLQEASDMIETFTEAPVDVVEVTSKVGDIITLEKDLEFRDGISLSAGDKIDQLSPADSNGCFIAHVFETAVEFNVVPVAQVCSADLK